jgi:hypothetical protein
MHTKVTIALLAVAFAAAPLSAQIRPRADQSRRLPDGTVVRSDGSVIRTSDGTVVRSSRKIPPGQLPPKGMCRVWIDGVPPGQQPPVTDCATAERNRVANSRVIYGDRESFPGRGKNKVKGRNTTTDCTVRDAVVVNGRVVDVCRDANGNVIDRRSRGARRDDRDDDGDQFENSNNGGNKGKDKGKAKGKGKHGDHDD